MGALFGQPDPGPSPAELAAQERAQKIGELKSTRDLARIRSQRVSTASLLNPGLSIPGVPSSGGGSGSNGGMA